MISNSIPTVEKALKFSFLALLAGFLLVLLAAFAGRIFYPFELEWMEGDIICSALRFAQGKAIYQDPAGNFVPFLYPPLYYWLVGLIIFFLGPQLWIGRLISTFSFFIVCFFIYKIVYRQTGDRLMGWISFLFLGATYKLVGFWFDVVRADSLFLAICLTAFFFLDKDIKKPGFWISAILFAAAFFTKQTAVFFIAAAILLLWREEHRAALYFSFLILIIIGAIMLSLNLSSEGWYWFYIFEVPSRHKTDWIKGIGGALFYIVRYLPVVCGIIFYGLFSAFKNGQEVNGTWLVVLPFAFLATALPYGKAAGYINNFYHVIVFLCILFGICLKRVLRQAGQSRSFRSSVIWGLLIFQSLPLVYNPIRYIPQESDIKAGKEFIEEVSGIGGEVYIPEHSLYGVMAGEKLYPKQFAVVEVRRAFPYIETVMELKNKISRQEFKAIYTDGLLNAHLLRHSAEDDIYHMIFTHYRKERIMKYSPKNAFEQFTGFRSRPNVKYIPNNTE